MLDLRASGWWSCAKIKLRLTLVVCSAAPQSNRLLSVPDAGFFVNAVDVAFHRGFGDEQAGGNGFVAFAGDYARKDFFLFRG